MSSSSTPCPVLCQGDIFGHNEFLDFPLEEPPHPRGSLPDSDILKNFQQHVDKVTPSQGADLYNLLKEFPSVTTDLPGSCTLIKHDIKLISNDIQLSNNLPIDLTL